MILNSICKSEDEQRAHLLTTESFQNYSALKIILYKYLTLKHYLDQQFAWLLIDIIQPIYVKLFLESRVQALGQTLNQLKLFFFRRNTFVLFKVEAHFNP